MTDERAGEGARMSAGERMTAPQGDALTASAAIQAIQDLAPLLGGGGVVAGVGMVAKEAIRQRGETRRTEINAKRDVEIAEIQARPHNQ